MRCAGKASDLLIAALDHASGDSLVQDKLRQLHQDAEFVTWRDEQLAAAVATEQDRALELGIAVVVTFFMAPLLSQLQPQVAKRFEYAINNNNNNPLEVISVTERYNEWVRASAALTRCVELGELQYDADPAAMAALVAALQLAAFSRVLRRVFG